MLHRKRRQIPDASQSKKEGKYQRGENGSVSAGHVEYQESPEECLVREVEEETGLTLTSYRFKMVW